MNKTQHKLAMEFFRSEIQILAKRIFHNKQALRHNQRIVSKGLDEPTKEYDKTGEKYWWCPEQSIVNDKWMITGLHIVYGELRGKPHLTEEKKKNYVSLIETIRKRMDEYIASKEAALVSNGASCAGSV
jgi:hypothetical protein